MAEDNNKNNRNLDDYLELLRLESDYGISGRKDADAEKDAEFLRNSAGKNENSENEKQVFAEQNKTDSLNDTAADFYEESKEIMQKPKKVVKAPPIKKSANNKKPISKKKKIIFSILAAVLLVFIVSGIIVGVFVSKKFNMLGDKIKLENDTNPKALNSEEINIKIGSSDFQNALKEWATAGNDSKLRDKNVINVLLIGSDEGGSNTDSMILVSVNKKKKTLKLISFLRDSYAYIETEDGGYCNKINAAYSMGGVSCLIKTIENNYKISIDGFVMVDFESFQGLIDAMGGVTVDVQEYEANYINSYYSYFEYVPAGEGVTLDGEQALQFCRVRGCDADADVSRTRRQRQVIESILNRVKTASVSELNSYIDALLPYVETSYSKGEVISLGMKAFAENWLNYERAQISMPPENARISGDENMWIWVVDYQYAAHSLQTEIYGSSNIVLEEGRTSLIDIYNGTSGSGSSSYTPAQTSTVPETTEPQTTDVIEETPTDFIQINEEPVEEEPAEELTEAPAEEEPTEETPEEPTEEVTEETEAPDEEETPADEEVPAEE